MARRTDINMAKARRDAALQRPELRGEGFIETSAQMPEVGRPCFALALDGTRYRLPMPVHYYDGKWFNSNIDRQLECVVVAWRYKDK